VTAELRGSDLAKLVGKTVQITGSLVPNGNPASGATEVVQVASATPVSGGSGGHSGFKTAAIVGGVAVVGTVAGLAAAGSFSGPAPTSAH